MAEKNNNLRGGAGKSASLLRTNAQTKAVDGKTSTAPVISNASPGRKGNGIRFLHCRLPIEQQKLFLNLPVIRRELAFRERLVAIRIALNLISAGQTQSKTAPLVGMSQANLCAWLVKYNEHGIWGLRERREEYARHSREADGVTVKLILMRRK